MRTSLLQALLAVSVVGLACEGPDAITPPVTEWEAVLRGVDEVPATNCGTPAVPCTGRATGAFKLGGTELLPTVTYTITITSPTAAAVTQAHIHTGAAGATGGISIWLCGTAALPGPAGTPLCLTNGTVAGVLATGTVAATVANVTSMRAFGTYANVHTTGVNSGGEIRGQLRIVAP